MRTLSCRSVLFSLTLPALACSSGGTDLDPMPQVPRAEGADETADVTINGVHVKLDGEGWPGDPAVPRTVTPLHMTIENGSDQPLRITYDAFYLKAPDATVFDALPPFAIEGTPPNVKLSDTYVELEPEMEMFQFAVLRAYDPLYPSVKIYGVAVPMEPDHYQGWSYWKDTNLPTARMERMALPEGVLEPGGKLDGWMYFEKIPDGAVTVVFNGEFETPDKTETIALVEVPFETNVAP